MTVAPPKAKYPAKAHLFGGIILDRSSFATSTTIFADTATIATADAATTVSNPPTIAEATGNAARNARSTSPFQRRSFSTERGCLFTKQVSSTPVAAKNVAHTAPPNAPCANEPPPSATSAHPVPAVSQR